LSGDAVDIEGHDRDAEGEVGRDVHAGQHERGSHSYGSGSGLDRLSSDIRRVSEDVGQQPEERGGVVEPMEIDVSVSETSTTSRLVVRHHALGSSADLDQVAASEGSETGPVKVVTLNQMEGSESCLLSLELGLSPIHYESRWLEYYDILQLVILIYTALVAPYQVAFTATGSMNAIWYADRVVDCIFTLDVALNFFRPPTPERRHRHLRVICKRYLKFWFWIDVAATIPYDLIGDSIALMKSLRVIRLTRLLKLTRLLRANKMTSAWEDRSHVDSGSVALAKLVLILLLTCHIMACAWAVVANMEAEDHYTWVHALEENKNRLYQTNFEIYIASLHFSVLTLTTVGYGDIVPQTNREYIVGIILMLVSGSIWAYILGTFTAVLSNLNPRRTRYMQMMDETNKLIRSEHIPIGLASRLRRYLRESQNLERLSDYEKIFRRLSPELKGDIQLVMASKMLQSIRLFEVASLPLLVRLMEVSVFHMPGAGSRVPA